MSERSFVVALTGASGFVGRHVLGHLAKHGHQIRALLRDPARLTVRPAQLSFVKGDLLDSEALDDLVSGVDAVVHLVGIINEKPALGQTFQFIHAKATRKLLEAATRAGVKRWVHMSALGVRPEAVSTYHRTKWEAECAVRESGLDYTIFRPSIIHGPDGEFMQMVKNFWCEPFPPFVPYFATHRSLAANLREAGEITTSLLWPFPSFKKTGIPRYVSSAPAGRLQPVWVEDVAECFAKALGNPRSVNETYPLGGPDPMTWADLYQTCRQHIPRPRDKKICAVPLWYARLIAGKPGVPFNIDQVIMSQENSTCSIDKVQAHFDLKLAPFEQTLADYASQID